LTHERIEQYELGRALGRGGMGEVFEARDTRLDRRVAIKLIPEERAKDRVARGRFHREARIASSLNHPHICTIHDFGESAGRLYLAMELLEGQGLDARIASKSLTLTDTLRIGAEVASALQFAHERGVVHRDIKPANIFITALGHAKVLDFGLATRPEPFGSDQDDTQAQLTQSGVIVGTIAYMSPEQARHDPIDPRSDLFSLGIVLYEMATGRLPFLGQSVAARFEALLTKAPVSPRRLNHGLPTALEHAIFRALQKDPARRYGAAAELYADLLLIGKHVGANSAGRLTTGARAEIGADETVSHARSVPLSGPAPVLGRTPLIGRERERAELEFTLEEALGGKGAVVLLAGEPGVGKSRIAAELAAEASRRRMRAFTGQCPEVAGGTPYAPFAEILRDLSSRAGPGDAPVVPHEMARELARIVPRFLVDADDGATAGELPPERERDRLFTAITAYLELLTAARPLVLVVEDLHWADPATLALFTHVAGRASGMSLVLLATFRDSEAEPGSAFARAQAELIRSRTCRRVHLKPLTRDDVREILRALGGQPPPDSLVGTIFDATEGNPFFVEEVFQHLAEEEGLFDKKGHWRADLDGRDLTVPKAVSLVVERRLERLSVDSRKVFAAAAVIGRRFEYRLLEQLGVVDEDALLDAIDEGEASHLVKTSREGGEVSSTFTHALIRHTLLAALSMPRRERLHSHVATAMEDVYANDLGSHAAGIAYHLRQSGSRADPAKLVSFSSSAAERSLHAAAYEDAADHYGFALDAIRGLPESPERIRQELGLIMHSVHAVSAVRGYTSPEVETLFSRARALGEAAGETPLPLLLRLAGFSMLRGDIAGARDLSRQVVDQAGDDVGARADGHRVLGITLFWQGDLDEARSHLERVQPLLEQDKKSFRAAGNTEDPIVSALAHLGWVLWHQGHPDQALALSDRALQRAVELAQPLTEAHARMLRTSTFQLRRDATRALESAEELLAFSQKHQLPFYLAAASVFRGWALTVSGKVAEGVAQLSEAQQSWEGAQVAMGMSYTLTMLAEALAIAGAIDQALGCVAEAQRQIEQRGEYLYEAELQRLQGELTLRRAAAGAERANADSDAERHFRQAIELSQSRGGRSFELRATLSLHELTAQRADASESRERLAALYAAIPEGRDTDDLRRAAELFGGSGDKPPDR